MKITILKLVALGVLIGGAWLLAVEMGLTSWAMIEEQAATAGYELPEQRLIMMGLAGLMVVFGFYAFIPTFKKRAPKRTITFEGEHGDVLIQLDPVQATLTRVLLNMPEIKRVSVKVDPDESGKNALIVADALLQNQPGVSARDTARRVTDYIAESAKSLLGLEELANIRLNVTGIHLNPKASSKAVRESQSSRPSGPPIQIEYTANPTEKNAEHAPLKEEAVEETVEESTDNQYTTLDVTASPSTDVEEEDTAEAPVVETEDATEDLPEAAPAPDLAEAFDAEPKVENLGGFDQDGEEVTSSAFDTADDTDAIDPAVAAEALDNPESAENSTTETNEEDDEPSGDEPEEKRGWKLFG